MTGDCERETVDVMLTTRVLPGVSRASLRRLISLSFKLKTQGIRASWDEDTAFPSTPCREFMRCGQRQQVNGTGRASKSDVERGVS